MNGLFWWNSGRARKNEVRRGAFLNLKRIALFCRVPRGTGVESKLPSVRTHTVGLFGHPLLLAPFPFLVFDIVPPANLFVRRSMNEMKVAGGSDNDD